MKILFYRYGSICEPDIIEGFEELGHTVSQLTNEITNKQTVFGDHARIVSNYLLEHPQDCVFTINFFPIISDVCNIFKIPYICWIVDSPVMELFTKSIQNPCNHIFLFDYEQYKEIAPLNPGCVYHFPLATNVKRVQQVIQSASGSVRNKFQSDVSFVGSLYSEKCPYDEITAPPDYLSGYLNGIMETQLRVYGYYFIEELLTDEICAEFKKCMPHYYTSPLENFLTDKKTIAQLYIGNKITAIERFRTMQALSEFFQVDLYTRSDTSALPKIHNRGFAASLTEMPIIFNQSKINLNTTSKAIRSGLPLRLFDIMGCGGFVMTNYQSELPLFFELDQEVVAYSNMEELVEKTAYYLDHEKERKEIAHNGFEKVAKEYNYPLRLSQMLSLAFSI